MKSPKRILCCVCVLFLLMLCVSPRSVYCAEFTGELAAISAVLIEPETGRVLYEKNADERLAPASVTKVMTLLLICEAIDSGKLSREEKITVSEYAASMGGSQVFLSPGEEMTANELLKCVVIASANDAAVALAEHIGGSEDSFVGEMNRRAASLGMKNTHFENVTGLDDDVTDHMTTARDIAIMSAELITKHPYVLEYSGIWMDSIRNGAFTLTNTNRLIRFYPGATGLKTGSTSKAKFCISASAERDGTKLIAVIMAAPTRDVRNAEAKKLLDFGFSNYQTYRSGSGSIENLPVTGGNENVFSASYPEFVTVVEKGRAGAVVRSEETGESYSAPIKAGDTVGRVVYTLDGNVVGERLICANETVDKISYAELLRRVAQKFLAPG